MFCILIRVFTTHKGLVKITLTDPKKRGNEIQFVRLPQGGNYYEVRIYLNTFCLIWSYAIYEPFLGCLKAVLVSFLSFHT